LNFLKNLDPPPLSFRVFGLVSHIQFLHETSHPFKNALNQIFFPDLPAELKTTELKTTELKITELKTTELKATELKTTELKTTELKTTELKTTELKTTDLFNNFSSLNSGLPTKD